MEQDYSPYLISPHHSHPKASTTQFDHKQVILRNLQFKNKSLQESCQYQYNTQKPQIQIKPQRLKDPSLVKPF